MKSFWKGKNVFVTGATGFLGSHITASLLGEGARVIALVRDCVPESNFYHSGLDKKVITVRGELEDYFLIERILNEYDIDTVFHLAAQTIVSIANRSPISTFESNIKGTWNLLEAARVSETVKRVVVTSSDKAYGDHEVLPYTEKSALLAEFPYDVSKACADMIAQSYAKTFDMGVIVTRCANLFGGGDLNFNRIVPGAIYSALKGENPVIRSDGKLVRDYLYVKDAVYAIMLLAEKAGEYKGEAFNISSDNKLNVLDITNKIIELMDKSHLSPEILNSVKCEIKAQYLSSDKIRKLMNWSPKYSLDNGLKETIDWYRSYAKQSVAEQHVPEQPVSVN
ncbi:MAG: GDP-mannose 4,6-dehydratase [Armatimonadota bacterium]